MTKVSSHEFFMDAALKEAKIAFEAQEVPIGAVVLDQNDQVIAAAYNEVERQKSQTAHAEILALQRAAQKIDDWRLEGCTLYVSLEPCTMCYAAAALSRVKLIVYGAESPVFGYRRDRDSFIKPSDSSGVKVISGIKEKECSQLLERFFETKR